ncbi:MAG TPA: hypothetical protein VK694_05475 [Verrucomicrobiae bacterium]|nr:hypothetical protein [Verrucomicrobiae bacterium]
MSPVGSLFILIAFMPLAMWLASPVPLASKILLPLALVSGIVATITTLQGNVIVGTLAGGVATFAGTAESHFRHKRDRAEKQKQSASKTKKRQ